MAVIKLNLHKDHWQIYFIKRKQAWDLNRESKTTSSEHIEINLSDKISPSEKNIQKNPIYNLRIPQWLAVIAKQDVIFEL